MTISLQKVYRILGLTCLLFLGLMMIQDLLTAWHHGYSYYWSESLLFSSGWLYVLPIALAMERATKHIGGRFRQALYLLLFGTALMLQVVLFSIGVYLFSLLALDHTYGFAGNLSYAFSSGLILYVAIYGAISVALYFKPGPEPEVPGRSVLEVTNGRNPAFVKTSDIVSVQSADPYLSIYTNEGRFLYKSTLQELSTILGNDFIRVHRSTLVNIHFVQEMVSRGNGDYDLLLKSGQSVRLSRRYLAQFRERLASLHSA